MKVKYIDIINTCAFKKGQIYNVDLKKSTVDSYFITNPDDREPYLYNKNRFVEVDKVMNKSDLKSGMVVKYRNGYEYVVFLGSAFGDMLVGKAEYNDLNYHNENLTNKHYKDHDIIEVYNPKGFTLREYLAGKITIEKLPLMWKRNDNSEEIEKVRNEIKTAQEALKKAEEKLKTLTE